MKFTRSKRNTRRFWYHKLVKAVDDRIKVVALENEIEQLKKDCSPFQAQIDQMKTYKVNE